MTAERHRNGRPMHLIICAGATLLAGVMGCASGTAWQETALRQEKAIMETAIDNAKALADIALHANDQELIGSLPALYRDLERYMILNPNATHEEILKKLQLGAALAAKNIAERLMIADELRAKRDVAIANLEDGIAINQQAREVNRAQMVMSERVNAALKSSADASAEYMKAREADETEKDARRKAEIDQLKTEAMQALGVMQ